MTLYVETDQNMFGAVRELAREIPVSDARMLREYFDDGAMFAVKAALRITAIAGCGGLLLALAGLYGVVSSAIARLKREIGIAKFLAIGRLHIVANVAAERTGNAAAGIG